MDFSGFQTAFQKMNDQKQEEAMKAANKPIGAGAPINLNTAQNLAERNRQKKLENMSRKAKERKQKGIERGTAYLDHLKMVQSTKLKDLRGKPRFKPEKDNKKKNKYLKQEEQKK